LLNFCLLTFDICLLIFMPVIPYEALGGEVAVRKLVDRFYDLMDTKPDAQGLRALHPPDLASSRDKLFMFLSGWLGGPPLFVEKFGHPRLRARHLPFPIGESERDQWLMCMQESVNDLDVEPQWREFLMEKFTGLADFMRNQEG
jgi:hemoglobin